MRAVGAPHDVGNEAQATMATATAVATTIGGIRRVVRASAVRRARVHYRRVGRESEVTFFNCDGLSRETSLSALDAFETLRWTAGLRIHEEPFHCQVALGAPCARPVTPALLCRALEACCRANFNPVLASLALGAARVTRTTTRASRTVWKEVSVVLSWRSLNNERWGSVVAGRKLG